MLSINKKFFKKLHNSAVIVVVSLLVLVELCEGAEIEEGIFSGPEDKKRVVVTYGSDDKMKQLVHQISSKYSYSSKEDRIYAMYQAMSGYSKKCQSSAISYLDSASYSYQHMWSSNMMVVHDADEECVKTLGGFEDVTSVRQEKTLALIDPVLEAGDHTFSNLSEPQTFSAGKTWGLHVMRVPEAWEYPPVYYGYGYRTLHTGKGIVVSSIDTGVNRNHITVKDNYRGYAAWMDGYNISNTPVDKNGHGTHTMGTICGKGGIGVAPGAQWITCRGCFERGCSESALLKCCQWIICPHDMNQTEPENYRDCSTAPDLVSNSWGGGQGDKTFERCALSLRAAGIIPVWAIGNEGPECSTASSPGDLEYVIAVGATNENDELCFFSSVGPTVPDERLKPDVSAPGMRVKSCWFNGTKSFVSISGTSMATPHVSGLIALMLERCPLPYDIVLNILQSTAERKGLGKTTQVCGGTKSDQFPNNFYGYGRVSALQAIIRVVQICQLNRRSYVPSAQSQYSQSPALWYRPQPSNYAYAGPFQNGYGFFQSI